MNTVFIIIGVVILVLSIAIIRSICDDWDKEDTKQISHPGDRK